MSMEMQLSRRKANCIEAFEAQDEDRVVLG